METKEEIIKEIEESPFHFDTKKKCLALLTDETRNFSEVKQEILLIMSEEMDTDMKDLGVVLDENDPEIVAAEKKFVEDIKRVEGELQEDMKLVEDVLDNLIQQTGTISEE